MSGGSLPDERPDREQRIRENLRTVRSALTDRSMKGALDCHDRLWPDIDALLAGLAVAEATIEQQREVCEAVRDYLEDVPESLTGRKAKRLMEAVAALSVGEEQ